jgi:hypothetical protein
MKLIVLGLALIISPGLVACTGKDQDPGMAATAPPQTTSVATPVVTRPPGSATAAVTPTSIGSSAPPVDGTVAPQNAGDTVPVTIKSNPDPIPGVATLRDVRVGARSRVAGTGSSSSSPTCGRQAL